MKKLILAGAAAIAFAAAPAGAQTTMAVTPSGDVYVLTDEQQTMYDAWPPERQTIYTAWPRDYQTYYWTLTPAQQNGWWVLTDDQRQKVYAMTPEQRTQAWVAIERQMAGMPASGTMQSASAAGDMRWSSNAVVQNISADAPPADPPICGPNMYDNCINAWEAGKRGPGVTRPLQTWPGEPASSRGE